MKNKTYQESECTKWHVKTQREGGHLKAKERKETKPSDT
jgi:hypothetical protein